MNDEFDDQKVRDILKERRAVFVPDRLIEYGNKRPSSDAKYLSGQTIEYILADETGSYTESDLEEKIDEAVSHLPIRIQRLINDLTVLSYGEHIGEIDERWDELLDIKSEAAPILIEKTTSTINSPHARFGYELAVTLSQMTGKAPEDERAMEFLWGMLLGHSATRTGDNEEEIDRMNMILSEFENLFHTTLVDKRSHVLPDIDPDALTDIPLPEKAYAEDIIVEELEKMNIEPTPHLVRSISPLVRYKVWDEDISKREAVMSVAQQYQDDINIELGKALKTEWDNLNKASVPGLDARQVLETLWSSNGPDTADPKSTSEKIAKKVRNDTLEKQVTHCLNRLSANGKDPSDEIIRTYENSPIVKYSSGEWILTPYGELLCYFGFDQNAELNWLHQSVFDVKEEMPEKDLENETTILERGLYDMKNI